MAIIKRGRSSTAEWVAEAEQRAAKGEKSAKPQTKTEVEDENTPAGGGEDNVENSQIESKLESLQKAVDKLSGSLQGVDTLRAAFNAAQITNDKTADDMKSLRQDFKMLKQQLLATQATTGNNGNSDTAAEIGELKRQNADLLGRMDNMESTMMKSVDSILQQLQEAKKVPAEAQETATETFAETAEDVDTINTAKKAPATTGHVSDGLDFSSLDGDERERVDDAINAIKDNLTSELPELARSAIMATGGAFVKLCHDYGVPASVGKIAEAIDTMNDVKDAGDSRLRKEREAQQVLDTIFKVAK